MTKPSLRRGVALVLILLTPSMLYSRSLRKKDQSAPSYAQQHSPRPAPSGQQSSDEVRELKKQVDDLNQRLDFELKASNVRYDGLLHATDRTLSLMYFMVYLMAGLGSLVGAVFVGFSIFRERQQRRDYREERAFYERQAVESETRQREAHSFASSFAQQQLQVGEQVVASSNEILAGQIKNMTELGGVITLVKDTFQMQREDAERIKKIGEKAAKSDEVLSSVLDDYENRFNHVRELVTTLKELTRMDWPLLSDDQEATAKDALDTFRSILHMVVKRKEKDNPCDLAVIYEILGASAYYATADIANAVRYIEEGIKLYEQNGAGPDYKVSQAFCYFYMGMIEKNWCRKDREKRINLESARQNLERSHQLLKHIKQDEFLAPVTLAEVLSYSDQERDAAARHLDRIISRLKELRGSPEFNRNQNKLLTRALLIRGNIDKMKGDSEGALGWYSQANEHANDDPYTVLSIADITSDEGERRRLFQK
jgi:tetratricopeptide (TPR) repeat protein